uniref:Uncharacterized protein LOC102805873 n=1 Tax=Saccoglossus kowalevskii TaxID=10224 RepID=A0ABM0LY28_SACKO
MKLNSRCIVLFLISCLVLQTRGYECPDKPLTTGIHSNTVLIPPGIDCVIEPGLSIKLMVPGSTRSIRIIYKNGKQVNHLETKYYNIDKVSNKNDGQYLFLDKDNQTIEYSFVTVGVRKIFGRLNKSTSLHFKLSRPTATDVQFQWKRPPPNFPTLYFSLTPKDGFIDTNSEIPCAMYTDLVQPALYDGILSITIENVTCAFHDTYFQVTESYSDGNVDVHRFNAFILELETPRIAKKTVGPRNLSLDCNSIIDGLEDPYNTIWNKSKKTNTVDNILRKVDGKTLHIDTPLESYNYSCAIHKCEKQSKWSDSVIASSPGVRNYKRTTQNQEKKVSDILNGTAAATTSKQVNVDLDEFSDTSSAADVGIHKLNTQDAGASIVYN